MLNFMITLQGMNSALSFACKAGHTEAVEDLVTSGASPNTANEVFFVTKYCCF